MKVKFSFSTGECPQELAVIWGVLDGEELIWDKLFLLAILLAVVTFGIPWEDENVLTDAVIILVSHVLVAWVNKALTFTENKGLGALLRTCDCVVLISILKELWRMEDLIFCFVNESDPFVNNLLPPTEVPLLLSCPKIEFSFEKWAVWSMSFLLCKSDKREGLSPLE